MLIHIVAVDFDKLLQDRRPAASAGDRETGRVVEMAVDVAFVFVV